MTAIDTRHSAIRAAPALRFAGGAATPNKMSRLLMLLFMMSMLIPVWIRIGPLLLMPHRIILLILFVPLLSALLSGKAGRIRGFDILMFASALWAALALGVNGSSRGASIPQQMGIYMLEAFGAYLLARVTIRSAEDFSYFAKLFFMALLILVPFGVVEAVTHRAVMLELIPQSVRIITNEPRWGLRRAQTVFGHPILFGVFCSTGFGLFWYVMRSKLTRVGGTALAFVGTFVSLSSGALLSVVFQTIFMGWEMMTKSIPRRWTIFSILFLLLYITIDLLSNRTPFHVLVSYATFNSGTAYYRILIWEYGIENVWTNPMFGLGANIEQWVRASWMHSSADNYWLLLAMQFGIPCFLFLASALFFILRGVSLAPLKDPLGMACRAGYLTAIGGLIIAGGTVHYWHGVMAFVMFFFGAGVWVIDAAENEQKVPNPENADGKLEGEDTDQGLIYTRQVARHRRAGALQPAQRRQAGLRGYAGRARAIAKHDRSG